MQYKKIILRDSLIVLPIFIWTLAWIILKLGFHMDFAPGSDYGESMYRNLLIPMFVFGIGRLVYTVVLITDIVRSNQFTASKKIVYIFAAWVVVQWFCFLVYLFRVIFLSRRKS